METIFDKHEIVENINRLIRRRYGCYVATNRNTSFTDLKFDKYDILYMILALEEVFDITITPEEMATINTINDMVNTVVTKLSAVARFDAHKHTAKTENTDQTTENVTTEEANAAPAETPAENNEAVEANEAGEQSVTEDTVVDSPETSEETKTEETPAEETVTA